MAVVGGMFAYVLARWGITSVIVGTAVSSTITVDLLPLVIAGGVIALIIIIPARG